MLGNPLAQGIVIIGCKRKDKNIDEVDLLFHFLGVVIDHLPAKSEGYK